MVAGKVDVPEPLRAALSRRNGGADATLLHSGPTERLTSLGLFCPRLVLVSSTGTPFLGGRPSSIQVTLVDDAGTPHRITHVLTTPTTADGTDCPALQVRVDPSERSDGRFGVVLAANPTEVPLALAFRTAARRRLFVDAVQQAACGEAGGAVGGTLSRVLVASVPGALATLECQYVGLRTRVAKVFRRDHGRRAEHGEEAASSPRGASHSVVRAASQGYELMQQRTTTPLSGRASRSNSPLPPHRLENSSTTASATQRLNPRNPSVSSSPVVTHSRAAEVVLSHWVDDEKAIAQATAEAEAALALADRTRESVTATKRRHTTQLAISAALHGLVLEACRAQQQAEYDAAIAEQEL